MSNLLKTALLAAALSIAIPHAEAVEIPLGAAADYVVLYQGNDTGKRLQLDDADIFSNATIEGNIGIGLGKFKENNNSSSIGGRLDFAAANSGQFDENTVNVGPDSVNYGQVSVTNAIQDATNLSAAMDAAPVATPSLAIGNGPQTVNVSAGAAWSYGGAAVRIFDLTSYSLDNGKTLTINGDGSENIVFNFNNSNLDLKGLVALTGGINPDQVLFNFTGTGNIKLKSNASYLGTILAPNAGKMEMEDATLVGRFFGSFKSGDATIHSGASISPYPYDPGGGGLNGAPEPSSIALLTLALAGLAAMRRRHPGRIRLAPAC